MLMRNTRQVACGLQQAERRNCFIHASLHHDAEDVLRRARRHFQLSGGDMLEALPDRALLAFQHVEPHTMGDTTSLL